MFEKLIGNDQIKESLEEAINSNNISHSYIFTGIQGIGKRLFAREYAKSIMCIDSGKCNEKCDSCVKFDSNSNTDFQEIEPDGKSIKIEQIRKMQEHISKKPIISNRKVYIINDAEQMTEEAQNCLLKTLEEPPQYAVIILIASNENKLLATIKSRCVTIKFNRISDGELKKKLNYLTEEQLELLDGSFSNIETLEKRQQEYQNAIDLVKKIKEGELKDVLASSEILLNDKENILEMLNYINIVLLKKKIIEPVKYVEKAKRKILANNNIEMCIDYLLINSWKSVH